MVRPQEIFARSGRRDANAAPICSEISTGTARERWHCCCQVGPHDAKATRVPVDHGLHEHGRAMKPNIDQRPGRVPAIETRDGHITFTMTPAGIPRGVQLIIRCDANGEIWLSIVPSDTTAP